MINLSNGDDDDNNNKINGNVYHIGIEGIKG